MDHVLLVLGNGVVETGSYRDGYLVGLRQSVVGRRNLRDGIDVGALNCALSSQSQEQHGNQTTRYGQRIGRNSRLPQPRETKVKRSRFDIVELAMLAAMILWFVAMGVMLHDSWKKGDPYLNYMTRTFLEVIQGRNE